MIRKNYSEKLCKLTVLTSASALEIKGDSCGVWS